MGLFKHTLTVLLLLLTTGPTQDTPQSDKVVEPS